MRQRLALRRLFRLAAGRLLAALACASPAAAADLTATFVTGGATHNLFIKSDKTLWGMGWNLSYELGDGTTTRRPAPILIATDVVSAAGGGGHTLFVKSDGTLWATGANSRGQLGTGTTATRTTPAQIATGVVFVAAGDRHTLFIKSDDTLWAMGDNQYGQLGNGNRIDQSTPVLVATNVATVSSKAYHTMFIKKDGSLWGMGLNNYGQLGNGTDLTPAAPVQIVTGVASVSTGSYHTTFVKTDGSVWVTGFQSLGALGDGVTGTAYRTSPLQIDTGVISASAGDGHTMFVKSNQQRTETSLWATGSNIRGQLGLGNTTSRSTPIRVLNGALMVFAGNGTSFYITLDGSLWAMGYNDYGQLGDGTTTQRTSPVLIFGSGSAGGPNQAPTDILLSNSTVPQSAGANAVVGTLSTVDADSSTFTYSLVAGTGSTHNASFNLSGTSLRANNPAALAVGSYSVRIQSTDSGGLSFAKAFTISVVAGPIFGQSRRFAAGGFNTHIVRSDGSLFAMGTNPNGELGDGTLETRRTPVAVATGVHSVATGGTGTTLFVKNDGSLWATGNNNIGAYGDGTAVSRRSPVQVATGVLAAAVGTDGSFVLRNNFALFASGWNQYGTLGIGNTDRQFAPVAVSTDATIFAAGTDHAAFIRFNTLYTMGRNNRGQLGDGTRTSRLTPVQVATDVATVAVGYGHTLFVKLDGSLWAFGQNDSGQLGDGTTLVDRLVPVRIVAADVRSVGAGDYHSHFVKADGSLWSMGYNINGALGDGTFVSRSTPVQVATGVNAVDGGAYHSVFEKLDGTFWGMGGNVGNLGDGTTVSRPTPVRIRLGPANDAFAAAATLAGASGSLAGTTAFADRDATDPTVGNLTLTASVWYRWTAPASGNVTFRLTGASSGTFLAAYTGTTAGALTQVAADTLAGTVTVNAVAGTVYHVMVDRWSSGGTAFTLGWEQAGAPPAPPAASGLAYLSNLSVLARAGTQSETLTAGLTVGGGTGGKSVLIRGVGPALSAFGVGNALADPILTVNRNNVRLSTNDDWAGATEIAAAATTVGAFALAPASRDAAILGPGFTAGSYVISLEGKNNAGGTALIEVYDTTAAATMTSASPRFTNIAARTFGGTGSDTLIVGFSIAGSGSLRVLVRASGPGLAPFGLTGLMPDPKLELYSGNTKLSENDNWDAATLATQNSVGAFPFPASSRDAVLVATLTPGSYTAQVVAQGGTGGVALLELYEIP